MRISRDFRGGSLPLARARRRFLARAEHSRFLARAEVQLREGRAATAALGSSSSAASRESLCTASRDLLSASNGPNFLFAKSREISPPGLTFSVGKPREISPRPPNRPSAITSGTLALRKPLARLPPSAPPPLLYPPIGPRPLQAPPSFPTPPRNSRGRRRSRGISAGPRLGGAV